MQPANFHLAKTDPETYSISDLAREKRTVWDGVTNPQAVKAIREIKQGDGVLIYHSGGERAVVGWTRAASAPRPDPANPKAWVIELRYQGRFEPPLTLAGIKASGRFNDWALVRQGRLSTMPAPPEFIDWLRERYPASGL